MSTRDGVRSEATPFLEVKDLSVSVRAPHGDVPVVTGVSFEVRAGQTLALVGESGCGKSLLTRAVAGLLPRAQWDVRGSVRLDGLELVGRGQREMRRIWGHKIGVVFQDSLTALNPVRTVGVQLTESLRRLKAVGRTESVDMAVRALASVGISDPAARLKAYPHQLSGGMRQRVCIAIALLGDPGLLIADEPTTGLDVTVQEQILDLMTERCRMHRMAAILVTHDLAVASMRADEVVVLYAGEVVEAVDVGSLTDVRSPYSRALLGALPQLEDVPHSRLTAVPGRAPLPAEFGDGCRFSARCPQALDTCRDQHPEFVATDIHNHGVRCWLPGKPPAAATSGQDGV